MKVSSEAEVLRALARARRCFTRAVAGFRGVALTDVSLESTKGLGNEVVRFDPRAPRLRLTERVDLVADPVTGAPVFEVEVVFGYVLGVLS